MNWVIGALSFIGAVAVAYVVGGLIGKAVAKLTARRKARLSRKVASVNRIDELEHAVDELQQAVKAIQADMEALSKADPFSRIETLAAVVNVQRGHIEALQGAVKVLNRRLGRLQEELENREEQPEAEASV